MVKVSKSYGSEHRKLLHTYLSGIEQIVSRGTPEMWKLETPYDEAVRFIRGVSIVGSLAYIEEHVNLKYPIPYPFPPKDKTKIPNITNKPRIFNLDYWATKIDPSNKWYGWQEFANFFRIRHCFAHNGGVLLGDHGKWIKEFKNDLDMGKIFNRFGDKVEIYYDINKELIVPLNTKCLDRCKVLCLEFLNRASLFGPLPLKK
ncbi:hypothetical protein ACFL5P_01255 [candidate division KSB1 bacterium]